MDDLEIQQHYDEFFEEIYVEMEKVKVNVIFSYLNNEWKLTEINSRSSYASAC